ncbi:MAG: MG2 domain-containing protein, partial [Planctomycetes bacterium]|nr:MG2 domain-containing protein [Planctomycetota bacterium]
MNLGFISKLMSDRRRFIAIASLLSVVVIVAVASLSSAWSSRSAGLELSSHTGGTIDRHHSPLIEFSRDIFDESTIASARVAGLLEIAIRNPAQPGPQPLESMKRIPGETHFFGSKTLRFHPAQRLPACTAFVLLLSERFNSVTGNDYAGPYRFEFDTGPLNLVKVEQIDFTREGQVTVGLTFNDSVSPGELGETLTLLDGNGEDSPYEILTAGSSASYFAVRTRKPVEEAVVLLEAGLKGESGPLGLSQTVRRSVPLLFQLRMQTVSVSGNDGFARPELHLRFNHSIDVGVAGRLKDWFVVEPPVDFVARLYDRHYWSRYPSQSKVVLSGPFKAGTRYKVTALRGLPGQEGYLLNATAARHIYIPDRKAALAFERSSGFLSPRGRRKLQMSTVNVESVLLSAQRVHSNNLVLYLSHLNQNRYYSSANALFTRKGEWKEFSLGGPRNEVVKSSFDLGQLLADEKSASSEVEGVWFVEARDKTDRWREDELLVTVTDIALSAMASEEGLLVWATSISGGKPLEGVEISLWTANNQELVSARTDDEGLARMNGPFDDRDGAPFVVLGEQAGSVSYLELEAQSIQFVDFPVYGRSYLAQGYDGFVYSDRGVYRPGDSVRIEAVVRDSWLEEPGTFPVEFEILRPDMKRFKLLGSRVDDSGAAGVSFKIPESSVTGSYRVALRLPGEDGRQLGSASFQVEDFVPSRMRLSVSVDGVGNERKKDERPVETEGAGPRRFHPGESVEVVVAGEYLAGLPARGVVVELGWSLSKGAFNPPGGAASGYVFGDSSASPLNVTGVFGSAKLDKDGRARFEVQIPTVDNDLPLVLALSAEASDTSGRAV